MRSPYAVLSIIALIAPLSLAKAAETPHLQFVQEYIRELSILEHVRAAAEKEMKAKGANPFEEMIHFTTRMRLELGTDISMLDGMRLNGDFAGLPHQIAQFYAQESRVYGAMGAIAAKMIVGPQPGVDYAALAAQMPSLRAQLESINDSFSDLSALVFLSLVDMKPDRQGHASHLAITREERRELLEALQRDFGPQIDHGKTAPALVNAAGVIKDALKTHVLCADDPW